MRRTLVLSLCIVAAGCMTSQVQRLDSEVRPQRVPGAIGVYTEPPGQTYAVIARIQSESGNVFESFDDLRAEIIDRAAQLGGEAVIVGPETTETEFLILTTGLIPSETKKLSAEVIVFR